MAVGLNISVAWFCTSRRYAHGEKIIVFLNKRQSVKHILTESFVVNYHLISRNRNERSLRIELRYAVCTPRNARRRTTTYRFCHDVIIGNIGQLFFNKIEIINVSVDENMLFRHNCSHTVVGLLQLSSPSSKKINKLFRKTFPATRPQTATLSTSNNQTIVMISHKIHICFGSEYPIYEYKTAWQRF